MKEFTRLFIIAFALTVAEELLLKVVRGVVR